MDAGKIYSNGLKEAHKAKDRYSDRSEALFNAYSKAVSDLGYKDHELKDPKKSAEVARKMFSMDYLGNKKVNRLVDSEPMLQGLEKLSEPERQQRYQMIFGLNEQAMHGDRGWISALGGLTRVGFVSQLSRLSGQMKNTDVSNYLWSQTYDPTKSLAENMDNYVAVINQDPLLAHGGQALDHKRFTTLDQAMDLAAESIQGTTNQEDFTDRWGVKLN